MRKTQPTQSETNGANIDNATTAMAGITIASSCGSACTPGLLGGINGALQLQQLCWVEKLLAPQEGHRRLSVDILG
ncbi:MAG: hypothetical protein ACOVP2_08580 [Armatimonadaceae bacterium]|jgi:hypothetical protein